MIPEKQQAKSETLVGNKERIRERCARKMDGSRACYIREPDKSLHEIAKKRLIVIQMSIIIVAASAIRGVHAWRRGEVTLHVACRMSRCQRSVPVEMMAAEGE